MVMTEDEEGGSFEKDSLAAQGYFAEGPECVLYKLVIRYQ